MRHTSILTGIDVSDNLTAADLQALKDAVAHLLAAMKLIQGVIDPSSSSTEIYCPARVSVTGLN
jgi:hypothetical protein